MTELRLSDDIPASKERPNALTRHKTPNLQLKAKFRYAILVADKSEAGRRPVADLLARASKLDSA